MLPAAPDAAAILITDVGIALALLTLAALLDRTREPDRKLFGATASALLLVYAFWRWSDTLPSFSWSFASLWPRLFIVFETVATVYAIMSMAILCRTVDRSEAAEAAQSTLTLSHNWPAVDIFICSYAEPLEVVERAILSALALDYPSITVWVLDDTRRSWLADYCAQVGARHVVRKDNVGAKAGNLNNGLSVSAGERAAPVILVLDADFAPRGDFLKRTVGLLLSDPTVAILQTPQFYYNADPIQHNLAAADSIVDDQRFFFDVFQPAKDAWGCAFCVGTSFIIRRDRLEEIGGFPQATISEDIHLTYALLARGYRTWWLNEPLSFGLAAEGVAEYITQRARWCLGTVQVALLPDGPIRGRGYTVVQRLHYLHGLLNWLCKPYALMLLIAPPIYWFAGVPAFEADYLAFLRYGFPALAGPLIYMRWISSSRTLPLFTEATHVVASLAITATLLSAIVKPFGRPFRITPKGGDRSLPHVHVRLASIFGMIAGSSALGIVWAFISPDAAGEISPVDYFNLVWAGIAMSVAFIAFIACFELPRHEKSLAVCEAGTIEANGVVLSCRINSLSVSTVEIRWEGTLPERLHLPWLGWLDLEEPSRSGDVITARLRPDEAQRRQLVIQLYSAGHNIGARPSMRKALTAVARRALRG